MIMPRLPEPGNTPVFPTGTYKVRISSYEFTKASTGTSQVLWKADIEEPMMHQGRSISTYTALTESALWKVSNLIGATGIKFAPNSIDTDSATFTALCAAAVGRTCYWVNSEGVDNKGIARNNIVKFELDAEQPSIEFSLEDESPFKD